ncbi:MAG: ABC transporter ATP-binding protein [Oenococcus sp.]|uniref:ABC transporter ATP-binding protein n=1 Tax=Oenococcus sp. TaxID=1979414 RepID=UPI0039EB155B
MFKLAFKNLNKLLVSFAFFCLFFQVAADLILPSITADIVNIGVVRKNIPYIWHTGLIMLAVSLLGIIGAVCNQLIAATSSQKLGVKLRHFLFAKITAMATADFTKIGEASLITRTTNDVVQMQNVTYSMLRMMVRAPMMLAGASLMAYFQSPQLMLVFVAAIPILAIVVLLIMRKSVPLFRKIQGLTDRINLVFREGLTGVRVIRAFNQDAFEQRRFARANGNLTDNAINAYVTTSLMSPTMTFIISASNIAIVWFGAHLIAGNQMPIGNLLSFITYATQMLFAFMQLSMIFVIVPRAQASAQRIQEVLAISDTILDSKNAQTVPNITSIHFAHVDFALSHSAARVLKDINLQVGRGQTLAIIGGTGSGKSSLINLIPRLFDPTKGSVSINDIDIRQFRQSDLHEKIAFASQKSFLFQGTIRSNLHYGNPKVSEEEMWQALHTAQADAFVKKQGGLDAPVEQNGQNFSGGQVQRLSIARAILKNADVYIFDDTFSALDFKTDALLRTALHKDSKINRAIKIIVAQRISTIADADRILLLEQGRISAFGTHTELLKTSTVYREIVNSQLHRVDAAAALSGDEHA